MSTEPAMPSDVVIARSVRAHTRALVVVLVAPLVLAGLAAAALSMAGGYRPDPPLTAGISMVVLGQVLALAAAVIIGRGLLDLLRGAGTPGSPQSQRAAVRGQPNRVLDRTVSRLALMIRVIVAAAVLGIAAWALVDSSGVVGAVVGAVLIAQVAVVVAVVRVSILHRTLHTLPAP